MIAAFLISAALLADASVAADTAPAQPDTAAAAQASPAQAAKTDDPVICKYEPVLGSRFSTRTCLKKSVRDEMARRAREVTANAQSKSLGPWLEPRK